MYIYEPLRRCAAKPRLLSQFLLLRTWGPSVIQLWTLNPQMKIATFLERTEQKSFFAQFSTVVDFLQSIFHLSFLFVISDLVVGWNHFRGFTKSWCVLGKLFWTNPKVTNFVYKIEFTVQTDGGMFFFFSPFSKYKFTWSKEKKKNLVEYQFFSVFLFFCGRFWGLLRMATCTATNESC